MADTLEIGRTSTGTRSTRVHYGPKYVGARTYQHMLLGTPTGERITVIVPLPAPQEASWPSHADADAFLSSLEAAPSEWAPDTEEEIAERADWTAAIAELQLGIGPALTKPDE